jgi:hypothetical protein
LILWSNVTGLLHLIPCRGTTVLWLWDRRPLSCFALSVSHVCAPARSPFPVKTVPPFWFLIFVSFEAAEPPACFALTVSSGG